MKSFLSIVVNCIMITLLIQCRAVKSTEHINTKVENKDSKETGAQHDGDALRQDTLFLYCDDFTGYFDISKKTLHYNGMLIHCLREKRIPWRYYRSKTNCNSNFFDAKTNRIL